MKSKLLQVTKLLHLLYEWLCCSLCFAFFEVVLLKQDVHYFLLHGCNVCVFVYSEGEGTAIFVVVCRACGVAAADAFAAGIDGDSVVLFPDSLLSVLGICKKHMEK